MIPSCQTKVNSRVYLLKSQCLYILWLPYLVEGALVNSYVVKIGLGIVMALAVLCSACLVTAEPQGNKPPVISSLESEYVNVYPRGASEIRCVASDTESDAVQFRWSSTGGSLMGEGPTVTWAAPSDYGDYHIMVIAKDGNGGSAEATLTISVIPRPYRGCCGQK
jgi:hypothetical protein